MFTLYQFSQTEKRSFNFHFNNIRSTLDLVVISENQVVEPWFLYWAKIGVTIAQETLKTIGRRWSLSMPITKRLFKLVYSCLVSRHIASHEDL